MQQLFTERLRLDPFTFADAAFFKELVNTPGWLQYIGDRNIHSITDAEQYIGNKS
jgi:[ribosomal protein S5]-alanine N-acetyltransferase